MTAREPTPRFILLALDPARRSGWAIFDCGEFRVAGPATSAEHREEVVAIAVGLAHDKGIPLVVGVEDWELHGEWSRASIFGMGAGWGRWEHILERKGYDPKLLFRVKVDAWRKMVLGSFRGGRDHLKALAMQSCKARKWRVNSDDAAEAALIGFYYTQHPPVFDAVLKAQKRLEKRSNASSGPAKAKIT